MEEWQEREEGVVAEWEFAEVGMVVYFPCGSMGRESEVAWRSLSLQRGLLERR